MADFNNENSFEKEAINILKELIKTQEKSSEIYELLGNIYRYHEKFDLAQEAYSEAIYLQNYQNLIITIYGFSIFLEVLH